MTLSLLRQQYRGAAVELEINGKPALGVLCFEEGGAPSLSSLCFTQGRTECPLFTHALSEAEVATLQRNGPRHLNSNISLTRQEMLAPASAMA